MKRMFVLAGTLAVLSASVVGASVWTGRQAEDRIEQLVASGNQAGQIYAVHLQSYRRGWFSSDAVTDVEIKRAWLQSLSPDRPVAHSVHIVFAEHVRHGPLLFGPHRVQVGAAHIGTRLVRISGPMGSLPVDRFHYRADSLLAFDGTLHSRLTVDPVDVALHGGARLHWDGLYARMTTSPDRHIAATMHAGPVQIRGPKGYFTLAGMDFTADLRQDLPGVYYGSEAISFHGLKGGANGAPRAAVQHVVIKGISALEPGHELRSRADFDISGIEIPQIDVQEVHLGVDVDHLPEQPFLSVRKRMMAINGQNLTLQHRARAMLHLWTNVLPALLADSPTVTLRDVHVVTRAGVVKADATVHYDASVKPVPGGPPFNIQALAVQAHLRIPVVLLHRLVFTGMCRALQAAHAHNPEPDAAQLSAAAEAAAHRKIGSLINEHMLVRDGDLYHANLSVEHGKVLINGYPAPVHAPAPAG